MNKRAEGIEGSSDVGTKRRNVAQGTLHCTEVKMVHNPPYVTLGYGTFGTLQAGILGQEPARSTKGDLTCLPTIDKTEYPEQRSPARKKGKQDAGLQLLTQNRLSPVDQRYPEK